MTSLTYGELELIVDLFTFSHGVNRNKQGGRVTLMWLAALSSGLAVLLMWPHSTLKKSSSKSSSLKSVD